MKITLVYLKHAGAGMKQRVQYRARALTTTVSTRQVVKMRNGVRDGAIGRSGGDQERKA
jgi:hypothetical protein